MSGFFTPHLQRFMLRILFGAGAFLWIELGKPSPDPTNLHFLIIGFLLYATTIFVWEQNWQSLPRESPVFVIGDMLFVGLLIALSGGAQSEMHLLLFFMVALRAPYHSWTQTFMIAGVATLVDIAAVGQTFREAHWFDFVVRILLLWFLAITLRVIGLRSVTEKQRSERLSRELSSTHDEVRRYTAALEKANAEKEMRLAEINLLHRFLIEVRGIDEYDPVYEKVFDSVHSVCEPAWLFLLHRRSPDRSELITKTFGEPPKHVTNWVLEQGIDPGCESDGARTSKRLPQQGDVESRHFVRCHENQSSVTLVLAFPVKEAVLLEEQVEILSALMDSVEMELELLRLRRDLGRSNLGLSESNRHLMRLHELQHELSKTFLASGDISGVIQGAHEIMAKDMFELDRLNLFLPDEERGMLQCFTSVGIEDYPQEDIQVPIDERGGAISMAFREGRTIFFDGRGSVPKELRLASPYSKIAAIRSTIFVVVPLINHLGQVIGVIGADRKHTHRPIPPETVTMLEFFARHVAMVLSISGSLHGRDA
ncbi:MAG: GAF domain-containing protein [bacterium]|nr:GAF domain-containing protein [bacterium]MDT8365327.1 GAF domain-containing protein [bacterium]